MEWEASPSNDMIADAITALGKYFVAKVGFLIIQEYSNASRGKY